MSSDTMAARSIAWRARPLCCRYQLVVFKTLAMPIEEGGCSVQDRVLYWGLGLLADGQHEVLGVWHEPASDGTAWQEVFDHLKLRGVEKIRFIAGIDPTDDEPGMLASYPSPSVLPSTGQFLRQIEPNLTARDRGAASGLVADLYAAGTAQRARAVLADLAAGPMAVRCPASADRWRVTLEQLGPLYAMAPRLRSIFRTADSAAQQLNRSLRRAVGRHGSFPSLEAATSFVAETLTRAERAHGTFGASPAAGPGYRAATRVNARSGIEAPGL